MGLVFKLCLLAFGDVQKCAHDPRDLFIFIAKYILSKDDGVVYPIFISYSELIHLPFGIAHQLQIFFVINLRVFTRPEFYDGFAPDLIRTDSGELSESLITSQIPSFLILIENRRGNCR